MKKFPMVYVKWEDHAGLDGYVLLEKAQDISLVESESIGYLIQETKDYISITMSLCPKMDNDDKDKICSLLVLSKKNILERKELTFKK